MGEWADLLVKSLMDTGIDFRVVTGLRPNMSGPEFEEALGRFLRNVEAFKQIKEFVPLTYRFTQRPARVSDAQMNDWYGNATAQLDGIIDAIRGSVVDNFNYSKVAAEAAADAYGKLIELLHVSPRDGVVYATTNYDPLGELALSVLGAHPDTGDAADMKGIQRGPVDVANLLRGLPRYAPVLHLHGKVGWYRQENGLVETREITRHDPLHGVPVIMLPDPQKTYADNDVLALLWSQFEQALQRASKTLVVGHSLNDKLLVKTLRDNITDQKRLAITLLADEQGGVDQGELDRLRADFGTDPFYYPLRFGRSMYGNLDGLEKWGLNPLVPGIPVLKPS